MLALPRGKGNALYDLYQIAKDSDDWFCSKLTIDDTNHISAHDIQKEISEGLISEDLAMQEFYCSFDLGVEGAYYAKYLDKMRLNNQITTVPWEPSHKVLTCWDLGVRDHTAIIFFQVIGQQVRIIDCYSKSKEGLEHYVKVLDNKPYNYGGKDAKHIFPHDIKVQELGSGITRIEKLRQLGITATIANDVSIIDGIEACRSAFAKVWIDEIRCAPLIKALENYRQEYDNKRKVYKNTPLHDVHSHFADAFRYLCVSLPKTKDGLSNEEFQQMKHKAVYGNQPTSGFFANNKY